MIPRNLILSVIVMLLISSGMGFYVWHVRAHALNQVSAPAFGNHVDPPASGPAEAVTLYLAYDESGVLKPRTFQLPLPTDPQQRAEQVLRDVVAIYLAKPSPHPLGPGSEIRNVYLLDSSLAVIDVNSAFSTGHPSGVLVEELTVASLVETLSANVPGVNAVRILVDGKTQDTLAGHADLTGIYDVAAFNQLTSQLQ